MARSCSSTAARRSDAERFRDGALVSSLKSLLGFFRFDKHDVRVTGIDSGTTVNPDLTQCPNQASFDLRLFVVMSESLL